MNNGGITPVELLKAESIGLPIEIIVEENCLALECLLRRIPGRRAVFRGVMNGSQVIVKLYSSSWRSSREFLHEQAILEALESARVAAPRVLLARRIEDEFLLVLEDLGDATATKVLQSDDPGQVASLIRELIALTRRIHDLGFLQVDIHPGNFILYDAAWHVIDAGAISRFEKPVRGVRALKNLALLLAQFSPLMLPSVKVVAELYGDASIQSRLPGILARVRKNRLRKYSRKSMRACTEYAPLTVGPYSGMLRRSEQATVQELAGQDVDVLMSHGEPLKLGNSATVSAASVAGKSLVIKRYNAKSMLKRFVWPFKSRARNSWVNQAYLRLLFVNTPEALCILSTHRRGVVDKEYYVCRHVSGEMLPDLCAEHETREGVLKQMVGFFLLMQIAGFSHGDSKYTNFIFRDGSLYVIDLDGMRRNVRFGLHSSLAAQRERLFESWHGREELAKIAKEEFDAYFRIGLERVADWL